MKLDKRLGLLYDMVSPCDTVADVGCDHGYLICALVQSQIAKQGYACDISAPSLEKAKQLIAQKNLPITCVCTDGLKGVPPVDTVIIAGMGGILIKKIIAECPFLFCMGKRLVVSPMSRPETLRSFLYRSGFEICKEQAALENHKVYSVMQCVYTGVSKQLDDLTKAVGMLPQSDGPEKIYYFEQVLLRLQKRRHGMACTNQDTAQIDALIEKINALMERKRL